MVYFIQDSVTGSIKIGFTDGPPCLPVALERLRALQTGNAHPLKVLCLVDGDMAREAAFHLQFEDAWMHGEWFSPVPALVECIATQSKLEMVYAVARAIGEKLHREGRSDECQAIIDRLDELAIP